MLQEARVNSLETNKNIESFSKEIKNIRKNKNLTISKFKI